MSYNVSCLQSHISSFSCLCQHFNPCLSPYTHTHKERDSLILMYTHTHTHTRLLLHCLFPSPSGVWRSCCSAVRRCVWISHVCVSVHLCLGAPLVCVCVCVVV